MKAVAFGDIAKDIVISAAGRLNGGSGDTVQRRVRDQGADRVTSEGRLQYDLGRVDVRVKRDESAPMPNGVAV